MKQNLLSFLGQVGVANIAMLLTMNGDVWWRGLCLLNVGSVSHLALWHSMSSTYGPQDIISLVTFGMEGEQ